MLALVAESQPSIWWFGADNIDKREAVTFCDSPFEIVLI